MHDSAEQLANGTATAATQVPRQIGFWVFVLKDALELHVARTLALIVAHSQVQDRLRRDIRSNSRITSEAINNLQYLDACVREQLRVWTPVPMLARRAIKGFLLHDEIDIAAERQILMYPGYYHRDPCVFGHIADQFSPDSVGDRLPPVYYFSVGPQVCGGASLALFMVEATLASLLARFRFELIGPRSIGSAFPTSTTISTSGFGRRRRVEMTAATLSALRPLDGEHPLPREAAMAERAENIHWSHVE